MIFVTSIPKSGTHLLAKMVEEIAGDYPYSVHKNYGDDILDKINRKYKNLTGHLRLRNINEYPKFQAMVANRKILILIRDPRDICASMAHFLDKSPNATHNELGKGLSDHPYEDKIKAIAAGIKLPDSNHSIAPLEATCRGFVEIQTVYPDSLVLRYEDFFKDNIIPEAIAKFLSVDLDITTRALNTALNSETKTKRAGVPSSWMTSFSPGLRAYFAEVHGQLIRDMGYEV